jgi:hypothetical protein
MSVQEDKTQVVKVMKAKEGRNVETQICKM